MLPIALRIISIFMMIGVGWIACRLNIINADTTRNLSRLLTSFFYPALIITSMTRNFTPESLVARWYLPVGAFGIMLIGFCIGLLLERPLVNPQSRQGHAFLFQCTINNFSFLPMPLVLMFWGETAVASLIFSSLGPELAIWTLGVYAISGRRLRGGGFKHLFSPPLLSMAGALIFVFVKDALPAAFTAFFAQTFFREAGEAITSSATLFGNATIPVAMLVAGSRMAGLHPGHIFSRVQIAVGAIRLILVPAASFALILLLPLDTDTRRILILVSTMPSAVSSVILSEIYQADSEFAASSVLITHLLCLITIPFWLYLLF